MDNYQNRLVLKKERCFVKVIPSHQFYLTCSLMISLITVINMKSLLVINVVEEVSLLQQFLNLKSCLKFASRWARKIMQGNLVSINVPDQQFKGKFQDFYIIVTLPFIFKIKRLPKTNGYIYIYTYLDVPFSNDLELKPIIQRMNNKVKESILFHKRISS